MRERESYGERECRSQSSSAEALREEVRECEGDREVRFYESKVTSLLSMEARHKLLPYSQGPQIMKHCS